MVLAGLPPLVGFYGKLLLFSYGLALKELIICGGLLAGSVWIIFIYVRTRYPLLTRGEVSDLSRGDGQLIRVG